RRAPESDAIELWRRQARAAACLAVCRTCADAAGRERTGRPRRTSAGRLCASDGCRPSGRSARSGLDRRGCRGPPDTGSVGADGWPLTEETSLMQSDNEILRAIRDKVDHPATAKELLQILRIPREQRASFKRRLQSLVGAGSLVEIRGGRFGLPDRM